MISWCSVELVIAVFLRIWEKIEKVDQYVYLRILVLPTAHRIWSRLRDLPKIWFLRIIIKLRPKVVPCLLLYGSSIWKRSPLVFASSQGYVKTYLRLVIDLLCSDAILNGELHRHTCQVLVDLLIRVVSRSQFKKGAKLNCTILEGLTSGPP